MKTVNRAAIVVQPKKPFVDWVNSVDGEHSKVSLDEICDDYSCYLIPEVLSRREQKEYLEQNYVGIFFNEASCWHADRSAWPSQPSFRTFLEWFTVSFHSAVFDTAGQPLWAPDES